MTIDINQNSALRDSYNPSESGCGCGNRRYYTKAEIDEMFKGVLDPDEIEEILDQMFDEYIESGDLYELILSVIGDIYTKEEIDQILDEYATKDWVNGAISNEMRAETARTEATYLKNNAIDGYATQDWVSQQDFLKDITLTINGTELHNNGEIVIEGGGTGGTVDISGKLDTSAFTQAMENETARTENTYAKKTELSDYATKAYVDSAATTALTSSKTYTDNAISDLPSKNWVAGNIDNAISNETARTENVYAKKTDFNSFTATTKDCCDYVKNEIEDIWDIIATLTGDTPTPPVPGTSTGSTIYITYNVTSNTTPTKIMNQSEVDSTKSRVYLTDGYEIIKSTGYTFEEIGLNSLIYIIDPETTIPVNPGLLYPDNIALNAWCGIESIVDVTIVGDTRLFYGERVLNDCVNLTGITVANNCKLWRLSGPSGCTSLSYVHIPSNTPMAQFGGFDYCPLITNITIPDSVQRIVYSTLNGVGLSSIILPENVYEIGGDCFNSGSSIESITIKAITPPSLVSDSTSLGEISKTFPIYVPADSVTAYKRNSNYQNYAYRIQAIPNE